MSNDQDKVAVQFTSNIAESPWWVDDIVAVLQPQTAKCSKITQAYRRINKLVTSKERQRKQAWDVAPYPSIGGLTWLNPYITLHSAHDAVLQKVKDGATIIDCGCFISPDLRYLAFKGAPTENMYGFDIESLFFDIGFDFYRDRNRWKGEFFEADGAKDLKSSPLGMLKGKVDVVWCTKYLHPYDREHQVQVACNLVQFLRQQAGAMFVGSQNGLPESQDIALQGRAWEGQQDTFFFGNAETMKEIWDEVAKRTGTK